MYIRESDQHLRGKKCNNDRMLCVILRGCWYDIALSVHA
jgi:hypothetical protein